VKNKLQIYTIWKNTLSRVTQLIGTSFIFKKQWQAVFYDQNFRGKILQKIKIQNNRGMRLQVFRDNRLGIRKGTSRDSYIGESSIVKMPVGVRH